MTQDQFCYWLQGFAELNASPPTEAQWMLIKEHLGLVFNKKTNKIVDIEKALKDYKPAPCLPSPGPFYTLTDTLPRVTC